MIYFFKLSIMMMEQNMVIQIVKDKTMKLMR